MYEICNDVLKGLLHNHIFSIDRLGSPPSTGEKDPCIINGERNEADAHKNISRSSAQKLSLVAFKAVAVLLRQVSYFLKLYCIILLD